MRAARAGAAEVVAVDTAAKAHARARRNYELSGLDPARMEQIAGKAKILERFLSRSRRFDIVIRHPPTFAHGQGPGRSFSAASDLAELAGAAGAVLEPGGLLAFASNAAKLSAVEVDKALAKEPLCGALSSGSSSARSFPRFPRASRLPLALCIAQVGIVQLGHLRLPLGEQFGRLRACIHPLSAGVVVTAVLALLHGFPPRPDGSRLPPLPTGQYRC